MEIDWDNLSLLTLPQLRKICDEKGIVVSGKPTKKNHLNELEKYREKNIRKKEIALPNFPVEVPKTPPSVNMQTPTKVTPPVSTHVPIETPYIEIIRPISPPVTERMPTPIPKIDEKEKNMTKLISYFVLFLITFILFLLSRYLN